MTKVSHKLRLAVLEATCRGIRQYKIAQQAGVHPSVMSSLLNDIRRVQPNDPRVISIGRAVGLQPADCFTTTTDKSGR
jgi:hypothetical protein